MKRNWIQIERGREKEGAKEGWRTKTPLHDSSQFLHISTLRRGNERGKAEWTQKVNERDRKKWDAQ